MYKILTYNNKQKNLYGNKWILHYINILYYYHIILSYTIWLMSNDYIIRTKNIDVR